MSGKPCVFGTLGTETWAPLMNSGFYLAKRRNPSVTLGCWLPVETWHCSQALKWIKKKCQRKEGNAAKERGDREYREVRFIVSAERGKKEKATEFGVRSSLTCCLFRQWLISKRSWWRRLWYILSFLWRLLGSGNTCLQRGPEKICWFGGITLQLFKNARLCKAASPVKLPPDFAVCWLLTAQGWRSVLLLFSLALLWLLKTHENRKGSRW